MSDRQKIEIVSRAVSKGHYLFWEKGNPACWLRLEGILDVVPGLEDPVVIEQLDRSKRKKIPTIKMNNIRQRVCTVLYTPMPTEKLIKFISAANRKLSESRTYFMAAEMAIELADLQSSPSKQKLQNLALAAAHSPSKSLGEERAEVANAGRGAPRGKYTKHRPLVPDGARRVIHALGEDFTKDFPEASTSDRVVEVHSQYASQRKLNHKLPALNREDIKAVLTSKK